VYGATCVYVSNILALLSTAHNHLLCTRLLHRHTTSYLTSCHPSTIRGNPITCIVHHRFIQITSQSQYPADTLRGPTIKEILIAPQNNPHQYYRHATSLNLTYIQFATQLYHQTTLGRSRAPEGTPLSIRRCDHDSSNECYGIRLFRSLFGHVMTLRQLMGVLLLALCYDPVTTALITAKPLSSNRRTTVNGTQQIRTRSCGQFSVTTYIYGGTR
jgi:hypothetical protein